MTVCCLARESKFCDLVELLSNQVMMRIVGRMEKLGGKIRGRTARGHSVAANPNYIRDVIAVLGLPDARPVSVKRTPTTESPVELESEKRAVYRTDVG